MQRDRTPLIAALTATGSATAAMQVVDVMERADAFRRAERFLLAVEAIAHTIDDADTRSSLIESAAQALEAAVTVDAGAIAREVAYDARLIGPRVQAARRVSVERALRRG